ncbi:hypothetical protein PYW08_000607 [Mythimna loreyi]|uniref:Uncharacterized protein n=1 Tax=Mythimna loreyi TaxID=667449 RepID=A0ACC2RCZ3_9NEOP|nr:hypothetical protein PYW08_000607 [Mythimna loreyi]
MQAALAAATRIRLVAAGFVLQPDSSRIPADQADNFRKAVETLSPTSCQNKALWLSSEITMIPPSVLREHNVSLSCVTQDEREFLLAVHNAYFCCISTRVRECLLRTVLSAQLPLESLQRKIPIG